MGFAINTVDGGYLIGGHTQSFGVVEDDYFIIKLNPASQEQAPEPEPVPEPEPEPELEPELTESDLEDESWCIPGFSVTSAIIGLIVFALLLSSRR